MIGRRDLGDSTRLTATDIDRIAAREIGSVVVKDGFEQVTRRVWLRNAGPIRPGVEVAPLKGAQFCLQAFVSLDFVPLVAKSGQTQWRRGAKSFKRDMILNPIDHPGLIGGSIFGGVLSNERTLTRSLRQTLNPFYRDVQRWLLALVDDQSVLDVYEQLVAAPTVRFGFDMYPQQRLGMAFVLARLGRVEDATQSLQRWLASSVPRGGNEAIEPELRRLLDEAGSAAR